MTDHPPEPPPNEVCLLLRAHAEHRWLTREVEPLLRDLEDGSRPPDHERATALAYLEALWIEACRRALQSDRALAALPGRGADAGGLDEQARRYHGAVRALRLSLVERVAALIAAADDRFTGEVTGDVLSREAARHEADCIRSGRWRPGLTYSRIRRTPTAR
ncbi:MAG TPA: hypothetical protein VEJ23_05365 [Solirubrobacteraceae bacterium]|nr:hypothetical protein [Solirubrobacteraceae bacterium]